MFSTPDSDLENDLGDENDTPINTNGPANQPQHE